MSYGLQDDVLVHADSDVLRANLFSSVVCFYCIWLITILVRFPMCLGAE